MCAVRYMAHIQIRNVPPELHRRLKARAAEHGLTLLEYLLREAEHAVEKPTIEELTRRIEARRLPTPKSPPRPI
jgi:plasmid stability protein